MVRFQLLARFRQRGGHGLFGQRIGQRGRRGGSRLLGQGKAGKHQRAEQRQAGESAFDHGKLLFIVD